MCAPGRYAEPATGAIKGWRRRRRCWSWTPPPPIARAIEGGCASTTAFEFSDGAQRIVVNCGGARATVAQVPASLAHGLRTTAAHSTLTLGDSNSTAIHADGTLGRGVAEVELSRQNRTPPAASRRAMTAMSAVTASPIVASCC